MKSVMELMEDVEEWIFDAPAMIGVPVLLALCLVLLGLLLGVVLGMFWVVWSVATSGIGWLVPYAVAAGLSGMVGYGLGRSR